MRLRTHHVLGVILAGGASRRFGADKTAAMLGGRPLLDWVAERARPQVGLLLLNANDPSVGSDRDLERLADHAPGAGPIAGILTSLDEAGRRGFAAVASFACDTPFFPRDTVGRLASTLDGCGDYAVARCGATVHRIFALWPLACRGRIAEAFASGARSMHAIDDWLLPAFADFRCEADGERDAFFNVNTPEDLRAAQRRIARSPDL